MMEERTLLFVDRDRAARLQVDCESVKDRANTLIRNFEAYQQWQKIHTVEDFTDLVSDPVALFDEVLLQNVNISATGGKVPNPETVAKIFDIDRDSFVEKTRRAISLTEFSQFEKFLLFQNKRFTLNEPVIEAEKEKFKVYITNDRQQAYYDHWHTLVDVLNEHCGMGFIGPAKLSEFGLAAGFRYVPDMGKLFLDDSKIMSEILKIQ